MAGNANNGYTMDNPKPVRKEPSIAIQGVNAMLIKSKPVVSTQREKIVIPRPELSAFHPSVSLERT